MPNTEYDDLPQDAQDILDAIIMGCIRQNGKPPDMTEEQAYRAMIYLLQHDKAVLLWKGDINDFDNCQFSFQLTADGVRLGGGEVH